MKLFYSLCCSELSCSPHRTPFTLYQWRPSSTLARATVHTPVSTRLPGKQDIWVWQWTLKCFDINIIPLYILLHLSENSFQKKQHFCSSWSNINFRMITKIGLIFIKSNNILKIVIVMGMFALKIKTIERIFWRSLSKEARTLFFLFFLSLQDS